MTSALAATYHFTARSVLYQKSIDLRVNGFSVRHNART